MDVDDAVRAAAHTSCPIRKAEKSDETMMSYLRDGIFPRARDAAVLLGRRLAFLNVPSAGAEGTDAAMWLGSAADAKTGLSCIFAAIRGGGLDVLPELAKQMHPDALPSLLRMAELAEAP
jgi:hypothetical protein